MESMAELINKKKMKQLQDYRESGQKLTAKQQEAQEIREIIETEWAKWNIPFRDQLLIEFDEFMEWASRLGLPHPAPTELREEDWKIPKAILLYIEQVMIAEGLNLSVYNRMLDFKNRLLPLIEKHYPDKVISDEFLHDVDRKRKIYAKYADAQRQVLDDIKWKKKCTIPNRR